MKNFIKRTIDRIRRKPLLVQPAVMRSSFVGKKFISGDVFRVDNFDYLYDAPFVYININANTFMSVTGKFYWKQDVKSIECQSRWSKFVWMFQ